MAFGITYHHCSDDLIATIEQLINDWKSNKNDFESFTSGSTGQPKRIIHSRDQISVSAKRTNEYFNLTNESNVLLCLSPKTIGGKMIIIRALVGDYAVTCVAAQKNPFSTLPNSAHFDFASLVPYQLSAIISSDPRQLTRIKTILIGGAALSQRLEKQCAELHPRCFIGYGMTETVSHIALRKLNEPNYTLLLGVSLNDKSKQITVTDSKLSIYDLKITDVLHVINDSEFEWMGRADFVINSAGIKIHPEQLEAIISTFIATPFIISSVPDRLLGERCVLLSEVEISTELFEKIQAACEREFGNYSKPTAIFIVKISMLSNGKIDRYSTQQSLIH
jgi:O-succinylbenzoic acid--CoA ligase